MTLSLRRLCARNPVVEIVMHSMQSTIATANNIIPIDWKRLHDLSDGNQEFEVELLKIFFVETKTQLQILSLAILESDLPTIEHLAHKLKGSSGNIGLFDLYQHASLLEHQVRSSKLTQNSRTQNSRTQNSRTQNSRIEQSRAEQSRLLNRMAQDLAMIQTFLEEQHSFSAVVRDTN